MHGSKDGVSGQLVWRQGMGLILVGALSLTGCWCVNSPEAAVAVQGHETEGAGIRDHDTQQVWDTVNEFSRVPSTESAAHAFEILEQLLAEPTSHPPGVAVVIFDAIANHRVESGRRYLVHFASVDSNRLHGKHLIRSAVRALGKLGGADVLETLRSLVERVPSDVVPTIAVALGQLEDPRAIPELETLARWTEPTVRSRALSALSHYCSETSADLAIADLTHASAKVRRSAAWWLAECGKVEHVDKLGILTNDPDKLVRNHAVKGLLRVNSKAGCARLAVPPVGDDSTEAQIIREYRKTCDSK